MDIFQFLIVAAACIVTVIIGFVQSGRRPKQHGKSGAAALAGFLPLIAAVLYCILFFLYLGSLFGFGTTVNGRIFGLVYIRRLPLILSSLCEMISAIIPLLFLALAASGKNHAGPKALVLLVPIVTTVVYPTFTYLANSTIDLSDLMFMYLPLILYYAVLILAMVWYFSRSAALGRAVAIAALVVLVVDFLLVPWAASVAGFGTIVHPAYFIARYFEEPADWAEYGYCLFHDSNYLVLAMLAAAGLMHNHLPMKKRVKAPVQAYAPAPAAAPYAYPVNPPVQKAPVVTAPETVFCTKCGKKLTAGSRFCIHCGTPVQH